ncbi:MAG: D-alanyl-D-alanine carboxypeptidase [Christensenellaceae bacterium]|jgi:D-alanyl-D-alanine carboxypeptidase (penicillin-binding protein 5/6)|nr:D-alanyl-D-alanine carboxypeptidase [Christensenellaceae bacterium]
MRRAKGWAAALLCVLLLYTLTPPALALTGPKVSAAGAVLLEAGTGKVLFEKNAAQKLPMASTTKVMTALLAIELGDLDEIVSTDASAYGVEGSSIYLKLQEELSLRDLLYGLMLASGNDAAVAIAVHIGQGVERFAEMMNARAKRIGAVNTNFVTPNGLPNDDHYTTAYDLALIAAEAMKNETFREIVSAQYYRAQTGAVPRTFKNKNKILWNYEGGNGIKTGYTKAAGRCLVFAARRDGMQLVGVVLNCPSMFEDAAQMLDFGMDNYELAPLVRAGDRVAVAQVRGGMKNSLELVAGQDIMVPVERGNRAQYRTRVVVADVIRAPVQAGQACGYVEVLGDEGRLLTRFELTAGSAVDAASWFYYFKKAAKHIA